MSITPINHSQQIVQSFSSSVTPSVTSPDSYQKLKDTVEQLADVVNVLLKKIESLEYSQKETSKQMETIKSTFEYSQILLPALGQDIHSLTKLVVAKDQQITLLTQELQMLKEALGLNSPPKLETPDEKEKNGKIRAELLNKD